MFINETALKPLRRSYRSRALRPVRVHPAVTIRARGRD
jgi:hypothetical protein